MTLELRGLFRYFLFVAFPIFFIVGLFGTIDAFNKGQASGKFFMLLWMGVLFYNVYKFSKMVIRIEFLKEEQIKFKTITGKDYEMNAKDFVSIKLKNNLIEFVTKSNKFVSMGNFDGFSEFIVPIKKANSDIVTKGC